MKQVEFVRPITVYWDLNPVPPCVLDYAGISEQLVALKPLQVQLLDQGSELGGACLTILEKLKGEPLAITLTATATAFDTRGKDLRALGLQGLFLRVTGASQLPTLLASFGESAYPQPGIAFLVTADSWRELPQVVQFCLTNGIPALTLPMHRFHDGAPLLLTAEEQEELKGALASLDCTPLRLTIHDPFLWKAFHPTAQFPGGGCQAGNTMIAIAPDGTVYPCPSLPYPLGSLTEASLVSLVTGGAKHQVRAALAGLPEECRGCGDAAGCRGGCRGRSLVLNHDPGRPDPACHLLAKGRVLPG